MTDTFENERSVLGCLTQYPEMHAHNVPELSDEFFSSSEHKTIYNAINRAYKKHKTHFDSTIVLSCLSELDSLSESIKQELWECCCSVVESTPFDEHLKILYDSAGRRFIKSELERINLEGDYTVSALKQLCDVSERAYTSGADVNAYKAFYDRYVENLTKTYKTVKTGHSKIDGVTGGLQKGTLCIVGARPSVGKTTFTLNIATNVAKQNQRVAFFSLEMTAKMVADRLCSRLCDINYNAFKKPLCDSDVAKIDAHLSSGIKENLTIIDDVFTVENICNYIVRNTPDLVVVDYAQIVRTAKKCDNIRVQIDYISSRLKETAKRTKCCVVLLSQLSRKATGPERPPSMSDLKESSSLEQDGDYIFLLHRPYTENKADYAPTDTTLIVEKNKFGSTGLIKLYFNGAFQEFSEITNEFRKDEE